MTGHDERESRCPLCHNTLPREGRPRVDLTTNRLIVDGATLRFTPQRAEILHILAKKYPDTASAESIFIGLYGNSLREIEFADSNLKQQICHIRKVLHPIGWEIRNERGFGYRLDRLDA